MSDSPFNVTNEENWALTLRKKTLFKGRSKRNKWGNKRQNYISPGEAERLLTLQRWSRCLSNLKDAGAGSCPRSLRFSLAYTTE
jgi:hypothetical protein